MPANDQSLTQEIEKIVMAFDFDNDLSANCAELLAIIEEDILEIAYRYWTLWAEKGKFAELDNPAHLNAMAARTADFIRSRLSQPRGQDWRRGLQAQIIDACKRQIPLYEVLAVTAVSNRQYYRVLGRRNGP